MTHEVLHTGGAWHTSAPSSPTIRTLRCMTASAVKFELVLAIAMLAFGMTVLPIAIFWVGQLVIGEYADGGIGDLLGAVWDGLGNGSPAAWILVLSPYAFIQLARAAFNLIRR